jgi:hypothetical protein
MEKTFTCNICSKGFFKITDLNKHSIKHQNKFKNKISSSVKDKNE